jgi:hypothetical protein
MLSQNEEREISILIIAAAFSGWKLKVSRQVPIGGGNLSASGNDCLQRRLTHSFALRLRDLAEACTVTAAPVSATKASSLPKETFCRAARLTLSETPPE